MRILVILFLLASTVSYSQEDLLRNPRVDFKPTKVFLPSQNNLVKPGIYSASSGQISEVFVVKGKPYEAFFCKLEVKTERFLGFGFQIHAGDYNGMYRKF